MGMSEPTLRVEVLLSSHHQSPEESVVASCAAAAERPVRARGLGAEGMHGLKPCPALAVAILDPPTIIAFTRCTVSFYHSGRSEWEWTGHVERYLRYSFYMRRCEASAQRTLSCVKER